MSEKNSALADMMMDDIESHQEDNESLIKKKLGELSEMIKDMEELQGSIDEANELLKKLNEQHALLCNVKIPDLFDEIGLSQVKLDDGSSVEIKRKYAASITAENSGQCLAWLRKNGHGAIIKHDVNVALKKEETDEHKELVAKLKELGVTFKDKEYVHHSTLGAFVRGMMESGDPDFPQELFKVFPLRFTKVKK